MFLVVSQLPRKYQNLGFISQCDDSNIYLSDRTRIMQPQLLSLFNTVARNSKSLVAKGEL